MSLAPARVVDRRAVTAHPVHDLIANRWSPRSFDPEATVTPEQVVSLLEAARWAPSASNVQPRRFVVARRGTPAFGTIVEHLMGFNRSWAVNASLLVVGIAVTAPDREGERATAYRWAEYDLGQSMANLATQAHALGLHAHPMGGIEVEGLTRSFDLPANQTPVVVVAVGTAASSELLPEQYREREDAERERLPLADLVLVSE